MPRLTPIVATLALACGPAPADPEPDTGTSTTTASTATADTPTTISPDTTTTADLTSTATTHDSHHPHDPDIFDFYACDPFAQDCPPGQKCAPYASDGGTGWDATKCVDVTGDGAPGDPCIAPEGPTGGIDDCMLGALCWDVAPDNQGVCVAQCMGSINDPICPAKHLCSIGADRAIALCLPTCDPLADECGAGQLCAFDGYGFRCTLDASGDEGQTDDPCDTPDNCDDGLACIDAASASMNCDPQIATGCCQPFCALPDGPCPDPAQQCLPWFTRRMPGPPGYENLGICALTH